ncbi:57502eb5-22eb-4cc0-a03f-ad90e3504aeb [Thermothielavioides terrestris]|uniref:57502eb5-22eb-4cc0-a03f-ad90e3504aeb n=1 Tax=Thermothielavioides terrestris TaxID=2587410 RepID=A0A3S4F056_9PEZI|nr:57502eb5-22eb-4cc0-a03f-ad90e3504aeb [Thermothielavioides terrestris]
MAIELENFRASL